MKKTLMILGAFILVILVAASSFWAGMAYRSRQAEQVRAEFMSARGIPGAGQMPGAGEFPGGMPEGGQIQPGAAGFPGRGATGQVKSIEGNVMTISTAQDVTTVNLTEYTQIEMTVSGDTSDLQTGMRVMVMGEREDDGVITASQVTILSENMPAMPLDQGLAVPPSAGTEP